MRQWQEDILYYHNTVRERAAAVWQLVGSGSCFFKATRNHLKSNLELFAIFLKLINFGSQIRMASSKSSKETTASLLLWCAISIYLQSAAAYCPVVA